MFDKNSKLYISIAKHPSNFGSVLYNESFRALNLNNFYIPCEVDSDKLKEAISGITALKIKGCSVAMPFKSEAMKYCSWVDKKASEIGAINTIVNHEGILKGYNTDYYGILKSLEDLKLEGRSAVLLGAGGVAKAVICALKKLKVKKITICNRTQKTAKKLALIHGCKAENWNNRNTLKADILVNATPIGMRLNESGMPINENSIINYKIIVDLILDPIESQLIKKAKKLNKITVPGYEITLFRAAKQFELYTGIKAPMKTMKRALFKLLAA